MNTKFRYCPNCNADLQGEPIPQEYIDKGYYAEGTTHYSRWLGLSDQRRDMITEWHCPDCGARWDRFTGERLGDTLKDATLAE